MNLVVYINECQLACDYQNVIFLFIFICICENSENQSYVITIMYKHNMIPSIQVKY